VWAAEGACDRRADPQLDLPLRGVPIADGECLCVEYDLAGGRRPAGRAIEALVANWG
jgi:hypothetical protein